MQGDEALKSGQTFVAIEAYSGAIALKRGSMLGLPEARRGASTTRRYARTCSPRHCAICGRPRSSSRAPPERSKNSATSTSSSGDSRTPPRTTRPISASTTSSAEIFYKLGAGVARRRTPDARHFGPAAGGQAQAQLSRSALRAGVVPERSRAASRGARRVRSRDRALARLHSGPGRACGVLSAAGSHPRGDRAARMRCSRSILPKPRRLIAVGLAHLRAGNRELAVVTLGRAAELFPEHARRVCRARAGVARSCRR